MEISEFLHGKSEHTQKLFWKFIETYKTMGDISMHGTKTMIAVTAKTGVCYITRLGKGFVDVVFPFREPYEDNLCFRKIAQVPGQNQYNHHLRLMSSDDINKEVKKYMKLALKDHS